MLRRTPPPVALGTCVALVATSLLIASTTSAEAASAPSSVSLTAAAYGTTAAVGPISLGKTASFSSCSTASGNSYEKKVEATDLGGGLGKVGAIVTAGTRTGNKMTVTSTAGATSLLGGLIEADAIKSTSTSELDGSDLKTSGSAEVVGLKIAGETRIVPDGVAARIDVPEVARITVNNQKTTTTVNSKKLTVEALRIDLLKGNRLGLNAGAIIISSSSSGVSAATNFASSGQAYGTSVAVGSLISSSPTANVTLPCGGSGGEISRNSVASVSLPGVLKVGTVASTAQSIEGTGTTTVIFGNRVAGVNLLNGAVTADSVTVKAKSVRSSSALKNYDTGTQIANLKVLGVPVEVASDPNSTINVAGIGTLTLHKTVPQTTGLDVVGIELKLGSDRDGVKAGTVIQVAVAKSRVAKS